MTTKGFKAARFTFETNEFSEIFESHAKSKERQIFPSEYKAFPRIFYDERTPFTLQLLNAAGKLLKLNSVQSL